MPPDRSHVSLQDPWSTTAQLAMEGQRLLLRTLATACYLQTGFVSFGVSRSRILHSYTVLHAKLAQSDN